MKNPTCHPNRKHAGRGLCGACLGRLYALKDPAKVKKRNDKYNALYMEKYRADVAHRQRHQIDCQCRRRGITSASYYALLQAQAHCCAICKTDAPGTKNGTFVIDHCHRTGRVRGLLCRLCNTGLGAFSDTGSILENAAAYLEKCSETPQE